MAQPLLEGGGRRTPGRRRPCTLQPALTISSSFYGPMQSQMLLRRSGGHRISSIDCLYRLRYRISSVDSISSGLLRSLPRLGKHSWWGKADHVWFSAMFSRFILEAVIHRWIGDHRSLRIAVVLDNDCFANIKCQLLYSLMSWNNTVTDQLIAIQPGTIVLVFIEITFIGSNRCS